MIKFPLASEGIPARHFSCAGSSCGLRARNGEEVLCNFSWHLWTHIKVRNRLAQGQEVGSISAIISNVLYRYVDEFLSGKLHLLLQYTADICYLLTICNGLYAEPSSCTEEIIANSNNRSTIQKWRIPPYSSTTTFKRFRHSKHVWKVFLEVEEKTFS